MYGLTTKMELIKCAGRTRGLAAVAMAALILLSALPTQTRAQGGNTYGGATEIHSGIIELMPGQSVSVAVPNVYSLDGSVRFVKHSIKVYEIGSGVTENESGLIYSGESGGLNEASHEFGHVFAFTVPGDPGRGSVHLWIEVESFLPPATPARVDRSADVLPIFKLIDESGKTVLFGLLLPAIQKVKDKDGR